MSEEAVTTVTAAKPDDSIRTRMLKIAGYVKKLPKGDRAELKRLRIGTHQVPPDVFWRIVHRYGIRPDEELFWLQVIPLMVEHEHRNGVRAGTALSRADVSAARIERWLRRDRSSALAEAQRLLTKVDSGFDWASLGTLLFFWNDRARMAFARDFFVTPKRATQHGTQSTNGDE